MTFTTLPALSDVEPPTVAFITPGAGAVSGPVTIEASASDNIGVVSVTFKVDGVTLGAPDASAPYTSCGTRRSVADGAHTLTAEARDAANHVSTATVVVLVQNAPVANAPHSIAFDGGNDYVRVADAPALSFGNGTTDTPMTIEAWVRPGSLSGAQEIVGKAGEYRLVFLHGALLLQLRDNSSGARTFVTASVNLSSWVGSWHHIAVTYDGRGGPTASQGVTIYLDGVAVPVGREDNAGYVAMENREQSARHRARQRGRWLRIRRRVRRTAPLERRPDDTLKSRRRGALSSPDWRRDSSATGASTKALERASPTTHLERRRPPWSTAPCGRSMIRWRRTRWRRRFPTSSSRTSRPPARR